MFLCVIGLAAFLQGLFTENGGFLETVLGGMIVALGLGHYLYRVKGV